MLSKCLLRVLGGVAVVCTAGLVWAADSDTYQKGLKEYQSGDVAAAMTTLRPSAEAGHAPSQALLGYIYDYSDFTADALALFRAAAASGNAEGHSGLAKLYLEGRGVAKDEALAFSHLVQAADLGHASSINAVADAYLSGSLGLKDKAPDNAKALAAVRRAADREYLSAIEGLTRAYQTGGLGLNADPAQAAQWQARAAALRAKRAAPPPKAKP